jgi:hypothetical protein
LQGFALKAVCPEQRSNEKRIKQAAGEEKKPTPYRLWGKPSASDLFALVEKGREFSAQAAVLFVSGNIPCRGKILSARRHKLAAWRNTNRQNAAVA